MAIEAGADALGLVARMPSGPGPIADATIAEVTAIVPPPVATFLLTSETTAEAISAHIRTTNPSTVQVVSHIDPAESEKLAALEPHVRRVQVIHIEGPEALDLIPAYAHTSMPSYWTRAGRVQQSRSWAEPAGPTIGR